MQGQQVYVIVPMCSFEAGRLVLNAHREKFRGMDLSSAGLGMYCNYQNKPFSVTKTSNQ